MYDDELDFPLLCCTGTSAVNNTLKGLQARILTNFFSLKIKLAMFFQQTIFELKLIFRCYWKSLQKRYKNLRYRIATSQLFSRFIPSINSAHRSLSFIQLRGLRQNSNNVQSFWEMTIYATPFCHPSHDWLFHDFILIPRCHNISCFVLETFIVMFGDSSRKTFGLTKKV